MGGRGTRYPLPFILLFEDQQQQKKALIFGKRRPWLCSSLGKIFQSKCSFKNIWEKKLQNIFLWCLFSCVFREMFIVSYTFLLYAIFPWNLSCPEKISGCARALQHYCFCKTLHLKCLAVFWICLYLDDCSVIFVVILCYVLHHTN